MKIEKYKDTKKSDGIWCNTSKSDKIFSFCFKSKNQI